MATEDRVLVEIVTAANLAGVEAAKAGFLEMNASTLALGVALGALIFIGKSAIENTEAQAKAQLNLKQAADAGRLSFTDLQTAFDKWADTNRRYIPDQYAAETALAAFIRAGATGPEALRELNDALDLSIIKSEDMSTAQQTITLALAGNSRGLKTLGITTTEYNAIMKSTMTDEQKHAALLALIESKTKDGRKAQTDLTQSTNDLNKSWQDITTKVGPPLEDMFAGVVGWVASLVDDLNKLGANKDWNKAVSDGLGHIQDKIVDTVKQFDALVADVQWLQNNTFGGGSSGQQKGPGHGARASGGPVLPGGTYTVGERGPETLVMGGAGGMVIPGAGTSGGHGHGVTVIIQGGIFMDHGPSIDLLTNKIAQRLAANSGL